MLQSETGTNWSLILNRSLLVAAAFSVGTIGYFGINGIINYSQSDSKVAIEKALYYRYEKIESNVDDKVFFGTLDSIISRYSSDYVSKKDDALLVGDFGLDSKEDYVSVEGVEYPCHFLGRVAGSLECISFNGNGINAVESGLNDSIVVKKVSYEAFIEEFLSGEVGGFSNIIMSNKKRGDYYAFSEVEEFAISKEEFLDDKKFVIDDKICNIGVPKYSVINYDNWGCNIYKNKEKELFESMSLAVSRRQGDNECLYTSLYLNKKVKFDVGKYKIVCFEYELNKISKEVVKTVEIF